MNKVKCINAEDAEGSLEVGGTYEGEIKDGLFRIPGGREHAWDMRRFVVLSEETNPKDALGMEKVNLFLVPPAMSFHTARAFEDGAAKYGAYNWRKKKVRASVYLSAIHRHVCAWQDGDGVSRDAGVHHLGHASACIAILLDAEATGNLIDDRPEKGPFSGLVEKYKKGGGSE